ncbi:P-loop containing nucleoside triphosphate hydrolase protein [Syncephalis plumigaleata]|nr:P-loop containing nucleoside triphosphate hydrolase protein [Syncephalis plumigaleata]
MAMLLTRRSTTLLLSLVRVVRKDLIIQLTFSTLYAFMSFSMPLFMNLLIEYIADPTTATPTMAMLYAVGLFVGSVLISTFGQRAFWIGRQISLRVRAILSNELFIKSLRRRIVAKSKAKAKAASVVEDDTDTPDDKKEATDEGKEGKDDPADVGSITNLLSVDTNSIGDISAYLHQIWFAPIRCALAFILLWKLLGAAMLFGLGVTVPLVYVSSVVSQRFSSVHEKLMKKTDKRLAASNEVLHGIRIIKLFAWEEQFRERVMSRRQDELDGIWKRLIMFIYYMILGFATPTIITFTIFGAHTWLLGNPLTASTAFTSLALLNILREAIEQLPETIIWTLQGRVSLGRIAKFLAEPDIEYEVPLNVNHGFDYNEVEKIGFEDADVQWSEEQQQQQHEEVTITSGEEDTTATANAKPEIFMLKGLNMQFPIGEFSVIAGPTGCGKSSLLHALLGEMRCIRGKTFIPRRPSDGSIFSGSIYNVAYVAQQAWLQNLSIRDNILFGEEYDETRYKQVIFACALERDLEILDAGDRTEIGEKGVTLSGGQKQRVALARAIYSSAKHILLDDCLSAVDAHTAKHIVEHCLQGPLMQGRTRILVTHHVELCAPLASFIVIMQEGRIAGQGSLETVLANGLLSELNNASAPPTRQPSPMSGTSTPRNNNNNDNTKTKEKEPSDNETTDIEESNNEQAPLIAKQSTAVSGKLTEDEGHQQGAVGLAVYRTYIEASGGYAAWAVIVAFYLLSQAVVLLQTYWLRTWANSYETNSDDKDDVRQKSGYYLVIYVGFGVLVIVISCIRNIILYRGSLKASKTLFKRLLDCILFARIRFFDTTPIGRIMNRFSKDIETIDLEVAICIAFFLVACVEALGTVVAISYVTPKFLFASVFIAAAYVVISLLFVKTSRELKRIESVSKSPLFTLFGEALNGVGTIRAFGMESRFMRTNLERIDDMNRPYYLIWGVNRWLAWRTDFFGAVVSFSAAMFIVFASDSIDAGLAWLIRMYGYVEMNMNSIERVKEYFDIEQEAPAIIEDNRVDENWPENGEVRVESLMLRYTQEHDPVVQDLSFVVRPGERVGIVGRTGAGKSTLAISLFRFVEASSGRIIIDGVDISKIGLYDLRSHLTIIPQDPVLFNGTIRSNIDPFDMYDDEAIWNALRRSHLIDGSDNRPLNGSNFSQGQRQLLAMARALLRNNKLIIMDEATASVDFDTDAKIQQTIRQEFSQATLLCIAHRLRTIIDYDKVLVMDAGKLVEYDSPYTLIQQPDSLFRLLCERSGEFETLLELASATKGVGSSQSTL